MLEALLQVASGRIVARVPLPDPEPTVIEHDGARWLRSHACVSGVAYQRERQSKTGRTFARRESKDSGSRWQFKRAQPAQE
jgi:hypothetical protein